MTDFEVKIKKQTKSIIDWIWINDSKHDFDSSDLVSVDVVLKAHEEDCNRIREDFSKAMKENASTYIARIEFLEKQDEERKQKLQKIMDDFEKQDFSDLDFPTQVLLSGFRNRFQEVLGGVVSR